MAAFSVENAWRAGPPSEGYWRTVAELREGTTRASRGEPALGFVVASVLGQAAALAPERRMELRRAGLGHVVAVSGMNVAVAAALVQAPLLRAGLLIGGSLTLAAALAWLPVLAYLGVTGGEPPALRAAVMFGLAQVATLTGRPGHGLTALAWTAAAMLAWRPAWSLDPGLQLSLAAMAVLVHPTAPRGLVAQSWRVSFGTLPIVLFHFGQASLIGVLANVIAVPVFTLWVLPLGILGLIATPWWGPAALRPAALGGQVVIDLAGLAARVPEPPRGLLAGLAVVGLVLRLVVRRPAVLRWVPGMLPCVGVLAVLVHVGRERVLEPPRAWVAIGGPRSAAVIVPAATDPSLACVRDPWLAPEAWSELLAALGFRGAAMVAAPRSPPAAAAVQAELERTGMMFEGTCPEGPSVKSLRVHLEACQARTRLRRVVVRAGPDGAGAECWIDGAFVGATGPER
ncbi:ComEC/Rec2 family competence protein [Nannocystis punicea]|uniref:ComEC/Rec2 family competence protein n=1 Tax=Nannocystis punicea TaxID=2995304 RepID=A0ABY7HAG6_9BACT|nr:ComEC/Rec2 family competence protein [Nannocystis poenicansa]WAS96261.1 ComEC/Rec2 family competence protein [Nannocystis poenicansa]